MKKLCAILCAIILLLSLGMACASARTVTFGAYGYEPITWTVLSSDSNYTKLMSEYVLACMPFDKASSEWGSSDVRAWLNNSFVYQAFSSAERQALCPLNGDLAWLPSLGDMTNANYGFATNRDAEDSSRSAYGSGYAIGDGLWVDRSNLCPYYTMTIRDSESLYQIRTNGSVGVARCDRDNVGIRPVIIVETDALR